MLATLCTGFVAFLALALVLEVVAEAVRCRNVLKDHDQE